MCKFGLYLPSRGAESTASHVVSKKVALAAMELHKLLLTNLDNLHMQCNTTLFIFRIVTVLLSVIGAFNSIGAINARLPVLTFVTILIKTTADLTKKQGAVCSKISFIFNIKYRSSHMQSEQMLVLRVCLA